MATAEPGVDASHTFSKLCAGFSWLAIINSRMVKLESRSVPHTSLAACSLRN